MENRLEGRYRLGDTLGRGNFGEVRQAVDTANNKMVAIKIEIHKKGKKASQLENEHRVLSSLISPHGFPAVFSLHKLPTKSFLVMELLGPNLEEVLQYCGGKFTMQTSLLLAVQVIDRLELLHRAGWLHRDVKPENFVLGLGARQDTVHMVDLGLATAWRREDGRHTEFGQERMMVGTTRYMSVNSHCGRRQSRRDDIESAAYMIIYFLKGSLPWQNQQLLQKNRKEKYNKVKNSKRKHPVNILCEGLPAQLKEFLRYSKSLNFHQEPQYKYLKNLFQQCYAENGFLSSATKFDWTNLDFQEDFYRWKKTRQSGLILSVETFAESPGSQNGNDFSTYTKI